jgi:hypothetical protein
MAQGQERIKLSNDAVGTLRCADVSYLSLLAQPVFARTYMKCATRKVILVSTPNRDTSSAKQEDLDLKTPGRACPKTRKGSGIIPPPALTGDLIGDLAKRHGLRVGMMEP